MPATQLRNAVARLSARADRDLASLWRQVGDAAQAREALKDILPAIVERYGSAAAVLAAEWYDQQRLKAGVSGRFLADPVDLGKLGTDELAGFAVGPLFAKAPDWSAAQSLVSGGVQRRIANASRLTVTSAAAADPKAIGWQRTGTGKCAFCAMLIGRGAVYTEAGADFASHDHCGCAAVPAFEGLVVPVRPYVPSTRNSTDADRARVRDYLRTH